jgi:hypothetical protein
VTGEVLSVIDTVVLLVAGWGTALAFRTLANRAGNERRK